MEWVTFNELLLCVVARLALVVLAAWLMTREGPPDDLEEP